MRVINEQDVFDIIDDLRNRMTVEGYWSMVERVKALPSAQPDVPDTNVGDTISRQAAIEVADAVWCVTGDVNVAKVWDQLKNLPSAQPEIIRCRNCKFASGDSRICMKFGHSPIGELDFCAWAERGTDE